MQPGSHLKVICRLVILNLVGACPYLLLALGIGRRHEARQGADHLGVDLGVQPLHDELDAAKPVTSSLFQLELPCRWGPQKDCVSIAPKASLLPRVRQTTAPPASLHSTKEIVRFVQPRANVSGLCSILVLLRDRADQRGLRLGLFPRHATNSRYHYSVLRNRLVRPGQPQQWRL